MIGIPPSLFKFRKFETNTLRLLAQGEVYFARPASFNDPFDCDPVIQPDADLGQLEHLWKVLALRRARISDPDRAKEKVARTLSEYRYFVTEHGGRYDDGNDGSQAYRRFLARDVKEYVGGIFSNYGVLSLSVRWDSPLMWSHYGDEHRGVCIEYSTEAHRCNFLAPVNYNSTRYLETADLHDWLVTRSVDAKERIFRQFFLAKAGQWRYEKEWRAVLKTSGRAERPFRIASILFGLRADPAVVTATVKLLAGSLGEIKFYHLRSTDNGFRLKRERLDDFEIEAFGVRDSQLFAADDFDFEP
ncbi:DUF2971 domain-containing protein [Cupriavidus sp. H18C1]|uniref:DUF2971 domain-containing protein n=1 Tax=Cupriavidus sp. H18C1 TaxID=3241601 RepID=UPI003BB87457